jgi:hypothetical protein
MDELDQLYGAPLTEVDHLRGAVGEVFSYFICRKVYNNADIEVRVKIGAWISDSVDTAGCNQRKGHCLQSKHSMTDLRSIIHQKRDLDRIEHLTKQKAQGYFITYMNRKAFFESLHAVGLDPSGYKVFDRADLFVLERRLVQ